MSKKQEQDQESKQKFQSEFDLEKIKNSAELDIKPKFELEGLGIDYARIVQIVGTYYEIEIPKEKAITGKTIVKAIDLLYNGTVHQFICEAESFRYQVDVIRMKKGLMTLDDIDGLRFKMWQETKQLDTPKFKGKGKVYCLQPL